MKHTTKKFVQTYTFTYAQVAGAEFRRLRKKLGISQVDVALQVCRSQSMIQRYETGAVDADLHTWVAMTGVIDMTPSTFFKAVDKQWSKA